MKRLVKPLAFRKPLALLLCLIMIFSLFPAVALFPANAAYAADMSAVDAFLNNSLMSLSASVNAWEIMSLSAFERYTGNGILTPGAREGYINTAINAISKAGYLGACASHIIALHSIGIDPARLYPVNSMTPMDAFAKIRSLLAGATLDYEISSLPFVLKALELSSLAERDDLMNEIVSFLVGAADSGGGWGWGAGLEPEADATAMVIAGLAPYYLRGDPDVVGAVDAALNWLADQQSEEGTFAYKYEGVSYFNESSTAQVVIALCSLGLDPENNAYLGKNALDGLLSFVTPAGGFAYGDWEAQGFRGFLAAKALMESAAAYDVYNFSGVSVNPGIATGEGPVNKPGDPVSDTDITVNFSLLGWGGQTWIGRHKVKIPSDATMYHLFTMVLDREGYGYEDANIGYIKSITAPDGRKLSDFDYGVNSGWVFSVNSGDLPTIGMLDYKLNDGDDIVWYYTSDYKKEPGALVFAGEASSALISPVDKPVAVSEVKHSPTAKNGLATTTLSSTAIKNALADVLDKREKAGVEGIVEIRITVTLPVGVLSSKVELKAADIKELAAEKGLTLAINCGIASFSLSSDTLAGLMNGVGDGEVFALSAECIKVSDEEAGRLRRAGGSSMYSLSVMIGNKNIEKFTGKIKVLLPFIPEAKINPATMSVYYLPEGGKRSRIDGARFEPGLGYVFVTSHLSLYYIGLIDESDGTAVKTGGASWMSPFDDVSAGAWYYEAVGFAYEKGLMIGTSVTPPLFSPDMAMSFAMFVAVLQRVDGGIPTISNPYKDVSDNAWYTDAVLWAKEKNIDERYGGGLFGTADGITREDLAGMLMSYDSTRSPGRSRAPIGVEESLALTSYTDAADISADRVGAMRWAVANGLIRGKSGTSLDPGAVATRAEVAAILQRYLTLIGQ